MKTVALPSGERVPACGQGTWNMGDDRARRAEEIAAQLAELDRLFPPPAGAQPLEML